MEVGGTVEPSEGLETEEKISILQHIMDFPEKQN